MRKYDVGMSFYILVTSVEVAFLFLCRFCFILRRSNECLYIS